MKDNSLYLFQKIHTWCTSFQRGRLEKYEMYYQIVFRKLLDNHGLLLSHIKGRQWKYIVAHTFTLSKVDKTKNKITSEQLYDIFCQFYVIGSPIVFYSSVKVVQDSNIAMTIRCHIKK